MSAQSPGGQPAQAPLSADDPREIGGYRLDARLGSGGMGVVYLARTPAGRPVALKAVRQELAGDPEFRRRFAQEVDSARRIHGLFTAQVVDSGVHDPTPWLATAYVPGPSLQQVVQRHGPLPLRTVLLLVAGIAEALQAIHRAGVVHRDLKPANVLIADDGPRVIDFGIARATDTTALTGTGLRIGTAAFMAPEQAMGLPVTPATDVFALGALAVYVAGGAPPFGPGPESAALYRVVHEQPDLVRVPQDLHDLLSRCLAKDPGGRPAPEDLIAAVHDHPLVGPRPEFTDGWLPRPVSSEMSDHARTVLSHSRAATLTAPAVARPRPEDGVRTKPVRRRRGRRLLVMAVAAAAALASAGTMLYCLDHPPETGAGSPGDTGRSSGGPSRSTAPSPSSAYTSDYTDAELTLPDSSYEFDLKAGKVVPAESSSWYLGRDATGFVQPDDSDAFISTGDDLSLADCIRGIETEPVTRLPFSDLGDERPFCIRGADRKDIAVVRLVEGPTGSGAVTVAVDHYRTQ
ncbi:serine/threonine-protein kinase [Streptomyces sp. NPDC003703]|uniref:serine/threonine-protein kinase n=1 Tax=Streptomyces sp. NPDC003283 TaxID=3364681 RepID=UPI00367C55FB